MKRANGSFCGKKGKIVKKELVYDIIVIGAGHAGIEASLASARMGMKTLCMMINIDHIGEMSCNPSIGGIAKGIVVREMDALGGQMAKTIDQTGIQFRMLNLSKGPAVWAPRAQADKVSYALMMRKIMENQPGLSLIQDIAASFIVENNLPSIFFLLALFIFFPSIRKIQSIQHSHSINNNQRNLLLQIFQKLLKSLLLFIKIRRFQKKYRLGSCSM